MQLSDFDYHLPKELIAQAPASPRDHSRLLVLARRSGALEHKHFYDLADLLRPGDVLVLNNTKVFPARLLGHKPSTGGQVEIFLLRELGTTARTATWQCLMAGRGRQAGLELELAPDFHARVLESEEGGTWQVEFDQAGAKFWRSVNRLGQTPLPPYIKRSAEQAADKRTYQTVFADEHKRGSVAAPTAGLHFTPRLIKALKAKGVAFEYLTLHVGLGTFASVKTERIEEHRMHAEQYEIDGPTLTRLRAAKAAGRRLITVGTTATRTLETAFARLQAEPQLAASQGLSGWTDIFIRPGYRFLAADGLITNFHVPKSTLLMLVSAFAQGTSRDRRAGLKKIRAAYETAIAERYRFYSYGDAMLIIDL